MQVPCNTVKFRGMYKETMKFLLRYTKKEPSPSGEGGPEGPDEGGPCGGSTFAGNDSTRAPHPASGGASATFPRGGRHCSGGRPLPCPAAKQKHRAVLNHTVLKAIG